MVIKEKFYVILALLIYLDKSTEISRNPSLVAYNKGTLQNALPTQLTSEFLQNMPRTQQTKESWNKQGDSTVTK